MVRGPCTYMLSCPAACSAAVCLHAFPAQGAHLMHASCDVMNAALYSAVRPTLHWTAYKLLCPVTPHACANATKQSRMRARTHPPPISNVN